MFYAVEILYDEKAPVKQPGGAGDRREKRRGFSPRLCFCAVVVKFAPLYLAGSKLGSRRRKSETSSCMSSFTLIMDFTFETLLPQKKRPFSQSPR